MVFTAITSANSCSGTPSSRSISPTCMRFWVSVPVLSVQITVTAPIVSQACIRRTRLFVRSMRRIDIASESVMLMGSPSGTAMTISATDTMKMWSTCCSAWSQPPASSAPVKNDLSSSSTKMPTESTIPSQPM